MNLHMLYCERERSVLCVTHAWKNAGCRSRSVVKRLPGGPHCFEPQTDTWISTVWQGFPGMTGSISVCRIAATGSAAHGKAVVTGNMSGHPTARLLRSKFVTTTICWQMLFIAKRAGTHCCGITRR